MADVPDDAPLSCPGVKSETAGKHDACQGCPNQVLCSSGQSKLPLTEREPDVIAAIKRRLKPIRHKIIILSGKGGVGKSSLSVCLARGLIFYSRNSLGDNSYNTAFRIGLLDMDLCGPSIPCMLGCMEAKVHQSQSGWSPVYVTENLALMSVGFLLPSPDHALIWRGPRKNALIRKMLTEVMWAEDWNESSESNTLDFLIIDTPPGTSDEHLSTVQYLQAAECLDGALIITTPQEVALSDVRKEIDFCRKLDLPILGVVENMTEFLCPSCNHSGPLFPPTTGGAASLCLAESLPLIGRIPLDPRLARSLDEGQCPFELAEENSYLDSFQNEANTLKLTDAGMLAYKELIEQVLRRLETLNSH